MCVCVILNSATKQPVDDQPQSSVMQCVVKPSVLKGHFSPLLLRCLPPFQYSDKGGFYWLKHQIKRCFKKSAATVAVAAIRDTENIQYGVGCLLMRGLDSAVTLEHKLWFQSNSVNLDQT